MPSPFATATATHRARLAVACYFLANGSIIGGWVPNVPERAHMLHLNPAQIGLILLAGGIGATLAMPLAAILTGRFGSKPVALSAGCLMPLAFLGAVAAPAPWIMALAMLLFGISGASMDVAMNAQGVLVEERLGRRTISLFHGLWSTGGVIGSAGTAAALSHGIRPVSAAIVQAATLILIVLFMQRWMFPRAEEHPHGRPHMTRPHGKLLLLGTLAFCAMLSEGAMADWSGLFLRVVRHIGQGTDGYGYSVFAAAMVLGRLTGDHVVARLTEQRALRFGGLIAAAGLVTVLGTHQLLAALPGFALIGIGLANTSPILYRSAGQVPGVPAGTGIATAVGIGYAGLLIGPPLLGILGHTAGLASIFWVVTGLCLILSSAAPMLRHARA